MTTLQTRVAAPAASPLGVRARDLLTCEWVKLSSIRSTYLIMLITVVTALGLSGMNAAVNSSMATGRPQADPLLPTFIGLPYAALAAGLLGILAFGSEHGTGLIRTTFAAVPRRRAVLAAKAAIIGAVCLAIGEALAFASFFLVQAILSRHHHGVSLSHPGVPGAVLAEGTILCVCALLGTGLGAIIRHTAGSVAARRTTVGCPRLRSRRHAARSRYLRTPTPPGSHPRITGCHGPISTTCRSGAT